MRHLLAILVIAACGRSPSLEVTGGTDVQRQAVEEAFKTLPLDRKVSVSFVQPGDSDFGGEACVDCGDCWIKIKPDMTSPEFVRTAVFHEFGHCVGLEHVNERGRFMHPRLRHPFSDYSKAEVDRFLAELKDKQ